MGLSLNQLILGLIFSIYGVVIYVLVPQAIINKEIGFAMMILETIVISAMAGTIMVL